MYVCMYVRRENRDQVDRKSENCVFTRNNNNQNTYKGQEKVLLWSRPLYIRFIKLHECLSQDVSLMTHNLCYIVVVCSHASHIRLCSYQVKLSLILNNIIWKIMVYVYFARAYMMCSNHNPMWFIECVSFALSKWTLIGS